MTEALPSCKAVRLRGRSFLALVLSPELPFGEWLSQLDDLAKRSTGFFLGRPIVLDVAGLPITREQLADLLAELGKRNVRVMGIEGALPSIMSPGMPPEMRGGRNAADIEAPDAQPASEAAAGQPNAQPAAPVPTRFTPPPATPSLLIDQPVRSGQSIIFPEGDVTVLGSVASGAEVIAGGSIHVYGALRGRALAGSAGNANARIFCRKLEAELIAIDGLYKTAEDLDPKMLGQPVHVWLDDTVLKTVVLAG
ncbi:septum site-determining protein MinC [Aureimonas pseudogalii]|uniref:Probable septum site-determining protein MinC n=1 Tax=Aureimonas pseudogalii TaxID=1744844 RepID=A0A7W6H4H1_9HYPH|nr:septum site-determining protein MinC [Aureimonas pseudogalii]MBB3998238.1 septum site-determining protein MinC [Aureimonas pseudogalii]